MSVGRIDVIATPADGGIYVSIGMDPVHTPDPFFTADLTLEEARYLRDELAGAIDKYENRSEKVES